MMFDHLGDFNVVLVTGPQRSGTTLVARAISHDTGLRYIDERDLETVNVEAWRYLVAGVKWSVIQCPAMSAFVHEPGIGGRADLAVVFVIRPVEEIIASQERIGWKGEHSELIRCNALHGPIATVKYDHWDKRRAMIANPFDVAYHDLEQHPLWVAEDERRGRHWGVKLWRRNINA